MPSPLQPKSDAEKGGPDPFLSNDFYPLKCANSAVFAALRADEESPDADLHRRVSANVGNGDAGASLGTERTGHCYYKLSSKAPDVDVDGSGSTSNAMIVADSRSKRQNTDYLKDVYESFTDTHSIPLPPYLANEVKETKLSSLMGLLPEANMVWLSVDDALYLWEYSAPNSTLGDSGGRKHEDFVCFKVPSGHCVVSVGLVRPKRGVFKDVVEWCLVITTPEEAILCALARESNSISSSSCGSMLKLIPTRYVIPTDSVPILSICGTNDGRIFMGGYDGCLYEMSYEGALSSEQKKFEFKYDEQEDSLPGGDNPSLMKSFASGSKRALSSIIFGPNTQGDQNRPRKCRKLNHSTIAPDLVSALVPAFVLRATSAVLGAGLTTNGGPIVNLTLDNDRKTMYALTSRGFIHAFDIDTGVEGTFLQSTPPRLACTIDVTKSALRYLDYVAHGRMHGYSGSESIAAIRFPGGGAGAQAGVGGMDGARSILKMAKAELDRMKSKTFSNDSNKNDKSYVGRSSVSVEGALHPISIHVVPPSESKNLTLVAISSGGLRYYLSVLQDFGRQKATNNVKPGRRFTLSHVRAPPPCFLDSNDSLSIGAGHSTPMANDRSTSFSCIDPGFHPNRKSFNCLSKKGFYQSGATFLAIDSKRDENESMINHVLAFAPDYSTKISMSKNVDFKASSSAPSEDNGINEVVSLPGGLYDTIGSQLPGGQIWDLKSILESNGSSTTVRDLFFKSYTPADQETLDDLTSPFIPVSITSTRNSFPTRDVESMNSPFEAATANVSSQAETLSSGIMPSVFNAIGEVLLNRPSFLSENHISTHNPTGERNIPKYRISERVGCSEVGFSSAVIANSTSRTKNMSNRKNTSKRSHRKDVRGRSTRLPSSLLKPATVPLSNMALQHISWSSQKQAIIALNSGGLYFFWERGPIDKLYGILKKSNIGNVGKDERVKEFFSRFGSIESCAMSISIAIRAENEVIAKKAVQAGLSFARRPQMIPSDNANESNSVVNARSSSDASINGDIEGFSFEPSSLYRGLVSLTSRLLRPIWCKPAVVVTEGKVIRTKNKCSRTLPSKVELLLDEATLEEIRKPLCALQTLMRDMFSPAVKSVPGDDKSKITGLNDAMDVERDFESENDNGLITRTIQMQSQGRVQREQEKTLSPQDLSLIARLQEDRNVHALYRLVSRTVQLLTLISQLRRAHSTPELPEVEFGFLHGLTFSQLVTSRKAQERIEFILTRILSSDDGVSCRRESMDVSAESNNLSLLLSNQCYLYLSGGSRLTYLGFRTAFAALAYPPMSIKRNELAENATSYFIGAARSWVNPSQVIGESILTRTTTEDIAPNNTGKSIIPYDQLATIAMDSDSPLARASSTLMNLMQVCGVVDICLICASNYGGAIADEVSNSDFSHSIDTSDNSLSWERGLYQRTLGDDCLSSESSTYYGNNVKCETNKIVDDDSNEKATSKVDFTFSQARQTCYGLLFHHLDKLLDASNQSDEKKSYAERMISAAVASPDGYFLHELYAYLTSSGHTDTLLRIESPALEKWLRDEQKDHLLLWKFYVTHGLDWMAGDVMWQRGCSSVEQKISLDDRIQCLTRALTSYSNSMKANSLHSMNRTSLRYEGAFPSREEINRCITQITEQLDVSKMQMRVLTAIESSRNSSKVTHVIDEDKIEALSYSLLDVSELYNSYAAPLAFYDICLLMLQLCNHNDQGTITTLWKSILCEELLPCRTSTIDVKEFLGGLQVDSMLDQENIVLSESDVQDEDGVSLMVFEEGEWIPSLRSRVVNLGKEMYGKGSDFTFPIDFIVDSLEGLNSMYRSVSSHPTPDLWPLHTLLEVGVSFQSLLDVYDLKYKRIEKDNERVSHLLAISDILRQWISAATSLDTNPSSNTYRRQLIRFSSVILTQIDSYKSSLESIVGYRGEEISTLLTIFSKIEMSLRRNFLS